MHFIGKKKKKKRYWSFVSAYSKLLTRPPDDEVATFSLAPGNSLPSICLE